MPKKAGIVFVVTGAVLIISALLLLILNQKASENAGQQAETILLQVQSAISQRAETATEPVEPEAATEPTERATGVELPEMPVVELDGYGYIGYLSIPALGLELPVMADWDYDRLRRAPCRQFGSTVTDDLVIAAHNYVSHFAKLYTLTDMNGQVHTYAVAEVVRLESTAVEAVQNSGHALVLYTCTYGGDDRVVVLCDRTENANERTEDHATE